MRSRNRIVAGIFCVFVLLGGGLTACSGAGGVQVSADWSGVTGVVVAKVNGLETVVGIDVKRDEARSFIVVPDKATDDQTLSPQLSRRPDGSAFLARPETSGGSIVYQVRLGDSSLNGVGSLPSGTRLLAVKKGWASVTSTASGSLTASVTDQLKTGRAIAMKVTPRSVATDGDATVCVADLADAGSRAAAVNLLNGSSSLARTVVGFSANAVGCWRGGAILAGTGTPKSSDSVRVRPGSIPVIEFGTRLDRLLVDGDTAHAVVSDENGVDLVAVDLLASKVKDRVKLPQIAVANDLYEDESNWIVVGDTSVAVVSKATAGVSIIELPGRVLPS